LGRRYEIIFNEYIDLLDKNTYNTRIMLSIGDLIDKLVIENIKIFNVRERLHGKLTDEEKVHLNNMMITLNENRGIIANALDEKVSNVISGKEKNVVLKKIKTYHFKNDKK